MVFSEDTVRHDVVSAQLRWALRSILILALIVFCPPASRLAAQESAVTPPAPQTPQGDSIIIDQKLRQAPGVRFVTTRATKVRQSSNAGARIIFDLAPGRTIYVDDTGDPDWLKLNAAGTGRYPDNYRNSSYLTFENGKILAEPVPDRDRDWYYSQTGYVQRTDTLSLDSAAPGIEIGKVEAVPQLWETMGLPDPRLFVLDQSPAPYNAVVQLFAVYPGSERGKFACTAFFAESTEVVVSAAHCIEPTKGPMPTRFGVVIQWSETDQEVIPVKPVAFQYDGDGDIDWAVLKLEWKPRHVIEPLHFHKGDEFKGRLKVRVLNVGYPVDLRHSAHQAYGRDAISISACDTLIPKINYQRYEKSFSLITQDATGCVMFDGNSGGPKLIWSTKRSRFEVVGVASYTEFMASGDIASQFSAEGQGLLRAHAADLFRRFAKNFTEDGLKKLTSEAYLSALFTEVTYEQSMTVPGVAPLYIRYYETGPYEPRYRWLIAGDLLVALKKAVGRQSDSLDLDIMDDPNVLVARTGSDVVGFERREDYLHGLQIDCIYRCGELESNPQHQLDLTYGDRIDQAVLSASPQGVVGLALHNSELTPVLAGDPNSPTVAFYRGGDLFIVERPSGFIKGVVRRFLNRVEDGDELVRAFRYFCKRCLERPDKPERAEESSVAPTAELWTGALDAETPAAVPGVMTVSAREVYRLLMDKAAPPPIVVAAMGSAFGLPGALRLPSAGKPGTFDDDVQDEIRKFLGSRSGGDKTRPIVVYCHRRACWLAYNTALRVKALGYAHVLWMREGVEGWITRGLPLQRIKVD